MSSTPRDDTVILGLLDESSHTQGPRVAHPRPGFIAPTATAGGDAPPIHDTQPAAASDRTCAHSRSHPQPLILRRGNRWCRAIKAHWCLGADPTPDRICEV